VTTAADVVAEARHLLLASGREELNRLTSSISDTDQTFTIDFAAGGIAAGALLAIDLELLHVWSVSGSTVTVQRGMRGSTAAAHNAGALITVNPIVSDFRLFTEVNFELTTLSSPTNGLYAVRELTRTMSVASTYDLAADLIDVLAVNWNDYGPSLDWPAIRRYDTRYQQDTTVFPSGVTIQLYAPPPPGRTLRVVYSAPFTPFDDLTTDVADTGLADTAWDIPAIGAAGRLLAARESRRSSVDTQPESRQAQDVPPGSARASSASLFALRKQRINEEAARLTSTWPALMRPAV
jgi:hypothetical protein